KTDNISLDVTPPGTPSGFQKPRPKTRSLPNQKQSAVTGPPRKQMSPQLPRGKIPLPRSKAKETPKPPRSSSPPVSASNQISNVNFALEADKKPTKQP